MPQSQVRTCFAVLSPERVDVFQASLKVVREEAGAQLSNKDDNLFNIPQIKSLT